MNSPVLPHDAAIGEMNEDNSDGWDEDKVNKAFVDIMVMLKVESAHTLIR